MDRIKIKEVEGLGMDSGGWRSKIDDGDYNWN